MATTRPTPSTTPTAVIAFKRSVRPTPFSASAATAVSACPTPMPAMAVSATPASRHRSPNSTTASGSPSTTSTALTGTASTMIQREARRKAAASRGGSPAIRANAGKSTNAPTWITATPGKRASRLP